MNLQQLKYAVEVAKTKSISKAAENLFMSQPNLSRSIKELEESLKLNIFERSPKGISVTPQGEEFLSYAKQILSQVEEIEKMYHARTEPKKQRFSVCVPRASYISQALTEFAAHIDMNAPADIFYHETNSSRTIKNVAGEEYNLGIIRYCETYHPYFEKLFREKHLNFEIISEFYYRLLVSVRSPLATQPVVNPADLKNYIEICHADPYVPSLPLIDVRKAELSEYVNKRIYVFERGSQFSLLDARPETFMWVSPIPKQLLDRYDLTQRRCNFNHKKYRDVLIYRSGYRLSHLDRMFIDAVCAAKEKIID